MTYMTQYIADCDYIRDKLGLPSDVSLHEMVVKFTKEFKLLEELLQKSQKEKSCQTKPKKQLKSKSLK